MHSNMSITGYDISRVRFLYKPVPRDTSSNAGSNDLGNDA